MYKYAELYGGKVRDIKESPLTFVDFCSIWEPTSFWMDVTGVDDIAIGWVIKSDSIKGTYFEKPEGEEEVDVNSLDYQKSLKYEELNKNFQDVQDTAFVVSSLGFVADAGNRANRDLSGLVKRMEAENIPYVDFRDYNNIMQVISLEEAKTLELEIIKNGQYIYSQKWEIERAIDDAASIESINKVVVEFRMLDFFHTESANA